MLKRSAKLSHPFGAEPIHRIDSGPPFTPIENVWAYLRANRRAISVFETYDDIVAQCCNARNFFANDIPTVRSITTRDCAKTVNR